MPLLSAERLQAITRTVARVYPAVGTRRPTLRRGPGQSVRLTYRIPVATADGRLFVQRVRVTVTPEGKILRIVLSR